MPIVDIFHFNDFHRRLDPFPDGSGGAARLAALIAYEKTKHPDALVLNGGDVAGDNTEHGPRAFDPIPELFNAMGVDALQLGNHEFEDPSGHYATLREGLIDKLDAEVLCANVRDRQNGAPLPGTKPYTMRTLNGVNVALIGVVTQDLASAMFPAAGAGLAVAPLEETLRALVPKVRAEGADAVVVLAHDGLGASQKLARQVAGVDLILAAHDHRQTAAPIAIGSTWVAEAGGYGQALGHVRLHVDAASHRVTKVEGELIPVSEDIQPDARVQAIVDRYPRGTHVRAPERPKWETVSLEDLKARLEEKEEARQHLAGE